MTDEAVSDERRLSFYSMALVVGLQRERKLRVGTRRAVLELRMEACRDPLFGHLYLDDDPKCPTCNEPGRPICWSAIHKDHDHSVNYLCRDGHHFWVENPLGRTKALRRGRTV